MKTLTEGTKIKFTDDFNHVKNSGEIVKLFTPDNCKYFSLNSYRNTSDNDFLFKSDSDGLVYSAQNYTRFNLEVIN